MRCSTSAAGAADAVALDEVGLDAGDGAVDEDEGDAVLGEAAEVAAGAVADGGDEEALDAVGDHVVEVVGFALEVAAGVAEDDAVAGAAGDVLGAAEDEGEEGVGEVGHDEAEGAGFLADQAAGETVGDVAELGDGVRRRAARVSAATRGLPLITRETVIGETPADAGDVSHRSDGIARFLPLPACYT